MMKLMMFEVLGLGSRDGRMVQLWVSLGRTSSGQQEVHIIRFRVSVKQLRSADSRVSVSSAAVNHNSDFSSGSRVSWFVVRLRFGSARVNSVKLSLLGQTESTQSTQSVNSVDSVNPVNRFSKRHESYEMPASKSRLGNNITKLYLASFAQGDSGYFSEFMARLE
ncbi:hypothetical protein Hanom_Chr16g01464901 [Helianthus anomalus]